MLAWLCVVTSRDTFLSTSVTLHRQSCNATNVLHHHSTLLLAMAIFSDLAIELQEAIWKLVLPASRGVHWVEIDGIPHKLDFIRDSIRMT